MELKQTFVRYTQELPPKKAHREKLSGLFEYMSNCEREQTTIIPSTYLKTDP